MRVRSRKPEASYVVYLVGATREGSWLLHSDPDSVLGPPVTELTVPGPDEPATGKTAPKVVRVLADEGLVEVVPGRGAYVAG